MPISKLEVIFCAFLAENNFVNALIQFIWARKWTYLVNGCREKIRESLGELRSRYIEVELFVDAAAVHDQLLENIQHCCGIFYDGKPALQMVQ